MTRIDRDRLNLNDGLSALGRLVSSRPLTFGMTIGLALCAAPNVTYAQAPGPESFVSPLKSARDFWEVSDYLVRTNQIDKAVPFLTKFEASNPDDATMISLREQFGYNSFLRLIDHASTRPFGERLVKKLGEAGRRFSTQPERIQASIDLLSKSPQERKLGVERLREAGELAVPPLIQALGQPDLAAASRAALVSGLGELDSSAVSPLIACLDSPDTATVASVATALGNLGDNRAVPALIAIVARNGAGQNEARKAIQQITGRSFESQKSPVRLLDSAARSAFLSVPNLADGPANLWTWDEASKLPVAKPSTRVTVTAASGLKLAREAVKLAPSDVAAKATLLGLAFENDPTAAAADAAKASPDALSEVISRSIADRRPAIAAAAIPLYVKTIDARALNSARPNALVQALVSSDRRVQIAAAEALIGLNPKRPFAGSSRVVPTLARFSTTSGTARAVVIDGNAARGSQVVGFLNEMGYDAQLAPSGEIGFKQASEGSDVELITIEPNLIQGSWKLHDTLANLRADAHTAGIPIFVVSSLPLRRVIAPKLESFPDVRFLVTPTQADMFKRELDHELASLKVKPLTPKERSDFAVKATNLLSQIATNSGNPFEADLSQAASSLTIALNTPITATPAAKALGDLPRVESQRDLADTVLNPSKSTELRVTSAEQLVKSVKRFGPLMSGDQERRLVSFLKLETEPALLTALTNVAGALKSKSTTTSGRSLQATRSAATSH